MSEIRTPNLANNAIFNAAQWNNALRGTTREIQEMMLRLLNGDDTPSAGGGGVLGGFVCDNVTGQMQSTVTAGWGWYYDATLAEPMSPFGAVMLHESEIVNHTAADGSNPRIDVISIASPSDTDTEESTLTWEAAPENRDTQRGAQPTIVVTAGTPAGSPVAPSTPAGHLKLCEVTVPAGATNLNSATYTDKRTFARGNVLRPADGPHEFVEPTGTGQVTITEIVTPGARSGFLWKNTQDWPAFYRDIVGAGEQLGELYPMLIPEGRTWRRCHSLGAGGTHRYINGTVSDMTVAMSATAPVTELTRASSSLSAGVLRFPLAVDNRKLGITDFRLTVRLATAFTGTVTTLAASLVKIGATGTQTVLGTAALNGLTPATWATLAAADFGLAETVLGNGEALYVAINWDMTGGGAGELWLSMAELVVREGRS
jgi:hypothetical protein